MALLQTVLTDGDGPGPRWQTWLREMWQQKGQARDALRPQALVRADRDRAGHAVARQLDHDVLERKTRCGWRTDVAAGPRRAEPDLDPGRQRGRPPDRRADGRRHAGGTIGEPFNRPMTAHFIGGCTIGDSPETGVVDAYQRVYGHPGLHVADGVGDLGQPRRQPVPHDHRPGRAGDVVLAQQGRAGPAPGARYGVPPRSSRSRRPRPAVPESAPGRPAAAHRRGLAEDSPLPTIGVTRPDSTSLGGAEQTSAPSTVGLTRVLRGVGPVRARPPSLPGRALIWRPAPCWGAVLGGLRRRDADAHLDSCRGGTRPGPGRRLRGAVRPAHRAAGPGGPRLLRDRAAHDAGRGDAGEGSEGDHPQRRPVVGLRRGCAGGRRRHLRRAGAGLRHVLRLPADGAGARRRRRAHGRAGVRPHPGAGHRARRAPRRAARRPHRLDVPRRLGRAAPPGFDVLAATAGDPGRGVREPRPAPRRRPVAPRGAAHRARPGRARALPAPDRRLPSDLDDGQHRRRADRADPRADRRERPRHLRSLRRRRLRRRGRDGAARDR